MSSQNAISLPRMALAGHQKAAFAILTAAFFLYWWQPTLTLIGVVALVVLPPLLYLVFRVADGDAVPVMLLWVAIFPLGYYFLSFPRTKSIITFDRAVVVLLCVAIALCPCDRLTGISEGLRRCAWAWFAFLAAALLSLVSVDQFSTPLRTWLDAFLLPGILAWYIIACFPVRSRLRTLHIIICCVSLYSAAIGAAEMYLGRDLLPVTGAGEYFAGQQGVVWIMRPNGPYLAQHSFSLIGLATFCLLGFLRRATGASIPTWQRVLHGLGMTAALVQAMLTLSRSIFITIIVILFLDLFRDISKVQKAVRVGILAIGSLGVVAVMIALPALFEERISDPGNIYARFAQQQQNLRLFLENPVLGVGLSNFQKVASARPSSAAMFGGVESMGVPHSNPGAVLSEMGLTGFVPYSLSQCLLVVAFWKLRRSQAGKLVWTFFLYVFLSYWITGLSIESAYYSDLNLWYLFCFAVMYKYAITKDDSKVSRAIRLTEPTA